MKPAIALALITGLASLCCSHAETYSLPEWSFSGGGNGSWSGGSSGPQELHLQVLGPPSGQTGETAQGVSATNILILQPYTKYTLKALAATGGPAVGYLNLVIVGFTEFSTPITFAAPATNYEVSVTISGPEDPFAGAPLRAKCQLNTSSGFGGSLTASNFVVEATSTLPHLALTTLSAVNLKISWPTSVNGYLLESAANSVNAPWLTITNAPVTEGTQFSVTVHRDINAAFFRLHKP